jgi:predicted phage terminase large subunit-like protein
MMQAFVAYTMKKYEFIWFHKVICEYLDKLARGEIMKLMIFVPPQHGKSQLSSRHFPAFLLGRDPTTKIAVTSFSGRLAADFNRDIKNIIRGSEYAELFPETRLNVAGVQGATNEINRSEQFETVIHRGGVKAVGIKGDLTGSPVDVGIIDDPFKGRQEANSATTRNFVWNWYQDVFKARLHDGSKQLMLFTRWHEDDLAGRILNPKSEYYDEEEAKEWTVLALPAIKEATKPLPQAEDIDDPREIGQALWEGKHGAAKYKLMKRINPTGYNSLAQQRPTAQEGNKIKESWFRIEKESELPFDIRSVKADFYIDGAYTEQTKNDPTALGSSYFHKANKTLYIFNCVSIRKELYELLKFFKPYVLSNGYKATSIVNIELKASGYPLKSMLSKVEHGGFNCRGIPNKVVALGKMNRVENTSPFLVGGRVVLVWGSWIRDFIDECKSFPNGVHDDRLDLLCYMVHEHFIKNKDAGGASYV